MRRFIYIFSLSAFLVVLWVFILPLVAIAPAGQDSYGQYAGKQAFHTLYEAYGKDQCCIKVLLKNNNIYLMSSATGSPDSETMLPVSVISAGSTKLLVNKDNSLPGEYVPPGLTSISSKVVKLEYAGLKLCPGTLNALYTMIDAAKKDGIHGFIINSAYRSITAQQQIFDSNLSSFTKTSGTYEEAYASTRQLVALPGNSEHHTGLALDIFSINGRHRNDFEDSREQLWLKENLQNYGFIIRYPKDKTEQTNTVYEPWHIRNVGIPLSRYLHEQGLCLEEFYDRIFAGHVIEDSESIFLGIKDKQKVFASADIMQEVRLETVNTGNCLLTINNCKKSQ
ncbi:D-alanyl-D-alanine carboxypeptidase [Ruminiclostridium hungatei]|uniref:D-alanyl-D-alanine carboxypeptidase n=1 Tax=Ruminiclostridium hungatei TaxID=48256 RepID=A0A1V4SP06_RUMHU|nr:M15 family metallopeptidase [Ruminiclostridium hungatei]OPX45619.1 D-alanyl-D-alanine carboxypeptidase [Ruminiclostridium hungatei]